MRRRIFLVAPLFVVPSLADIRQEVTELFGVMATALSSANPDLFLRSIDPDLPNYGIFADNVRALTSRNNLSSSIEIVSQEGDDAVQNVELDWLLDVGGVRRQSIVKCRLQRKKKKWQIVALDPASFFSPAG
jgi:hypothetical protein